MRCLAQRAELRALFLGEGVKAQVQFIQNLQPQAHLIALVTRLEPEACARRLDRSYAARPRVKCIVARLLFFPHRAAISRYREYAGIASEQSIRQFG